MRWLSRPTIFAATLRTSEVLANFKITAGQPRHLFRTRRGQQRRPHGRVARLRGQAGRSRPGHGVFSAGRRNLIPILRRLTNPFFKRGGKITAFQTEFKVLVTDVQSYLTGVRHWLEQLEFGMKPSRDRPSRSAPFWMPSRPESSPPSTASTSGLKKSFTRCRRKRAARIRILSASTGTNYFWVRPSAIAPITSPSATPAITR